MWELEQYVHILEGRLQKATGALLLPGGHQAPTPAQASVWGSRSPTLQGGGGGARPCGGVSQPE